MIDIAIPRSLEAIDVAFVEHLIAGEHPGARIEHMEITGEIHGTATKARLELRYAQDVGAPAVVWLKAGYEPHSATLYKDGIYALEPKVYAELLPGLPVRAPRHHGTTYDELAGEGVVLLEDLGGAARINSPESDITPDEVAAMLLMLARMHGTTSRPGWLAARPWIQPALEGFGEPQSYLTYMGEPANIERFLKWPRSADFPPSMFDPQAIHDGLRRVFDWSMSVKQPCLVHGDAHVGNSYVDAEGRPGMLDWQCVRRSGWAFDVSYYLTSALSVEDRRKHERELLKDYLGAFVAAGGPAQDWDEAWSDFGLALGYGFSAWLANDPALQSERNNTIVSHRFAWAIVDHGTYGR